MPEIVDLEVAKDNMLKKVKGSALKKIEVPVEKVLQNAEPIDLKDSLESKKILDMSRIGKVLVFEFENDVKLCTHLMLHGDFCWESSKKKSPHVVCSLAFSTGDTILIKDWSAWMKIELDDPSKGIKSEILNLEYGIDPLSRDFTEEVFSQILDKKSRSGIKSLMLDQKVISGIGNAYTDESLFEAEIHPKSKAGGILKAGLAAKLCKSIRKVIKQAIDIVSDLSKGEEISEQERDFMKVYRKSGQKCPRCGYMIASFKVSGRDTFVCEKCQKIL